MQRLVVCLLAFWIVAPVQAQDRPVDLELALGIDVSGSVDDEEAILQRQGYIAAFRHPDVIRAIEHGMLGRIAVGYYEWAGYGHMRVIADWTEIRDAKSANAFADMLTLNPPRTAHRTAIAAAIDFAALWFDMNAFEGTRRVVDISGDGPNNWGGLVAVARDRAVARGVTINGLPIVNDRPSLSGRPQIRNLDLYYRDCVIGGPGAFIVVANTFEEFAVAVRKKLIIEIAGSMGQTHAAAQRDGRGTGDADRRSASSGTARRLATDVPFRPRLIPAQLKPDRIAPPCDIGERRWDDYEDF
ncbi:MAG: DUF1194 domain-containing protein [Alphaproteobacteria bacterium]|nr:DUF1194 domain-containing protein [Alphaproteobacteria bacterium]